MCLKHWATEGADGRSTGIRDDSEAAERALAGAPLEVRRQVSAPYTFATKADANAWLSAVETDVARGQFVDPAKGTVTFGKYAREWMDHKANLQPRTRETLERYQSCDLIELR